MKKRPQVTSIFLSWSLSWFCSVCLDLKHFKFKLQDVWKRGLGPFIPLFKECRFSPKLSNYVIQVTLTLSLPIYDCSCFERRTIIRHGFNQSTKATGRVCFFFFFLFQKISASGSQTGCDYCVTLPILNPFRRVTQCRVYLDSWIHY